MNFFNYIIIYSVNILFQSTIILCLGLGLAYAFRKKGAAFQSVVLRSFLVVVLLSPFVSIFMNSLHLNFINFNVLRLDFIQLDTIHYQDKNKQNNFQIIKNPLQYESPFSKYADQSSDKTFYYSESKTYTINNSIPDHQQKNILGDNSRQAVNGTFKQNFSEKHPPENIVKSNVIQSKKSSSPSTRNWWAVFCYISVALWMVSSLLLFIRFISAHYKLRMLRISACDAKPEFIKLCKKVSREFEIEAPVVLQGQKVKTTLIAGFFKPFILLPLGENETFFASREVFLHEFAHLKRNDFLWNQLSQIGMVIFPVQPLMWILSHWIEETSDYVCDDYVTYFTKNYRLYAVNLSHIAKLYLSIGSELRAGVGFISFESPLRRRIKRILDKSKIISLKTNTRFVLCISIICLSAMLLTGFISVEGKSMPKSSDIIEEHYKQVKKLNNNTVVGVINTNDFFSVEEISANHQVNQEETLSTKNSNEKKEIKPETVDITGISSFKNNLSDAPILEEESIHKHNQILSTDVISSVENMSTEKETEKADTIKDDNQYEKSKTNKDQNREHDSSNDEELKKIDAQITESNIYIDDDSDFDEKDLFSVQNIGLNLFASRNENNMSSTAKPVPVQFDKGKYIDNINFRKLDRIAYNPVWSPDGKWIAFFSKTHDKYFYSNTLWIVPSEGGEPKLIYKVNLNISPAPINGSREDGILSVCFTPDSREVTFSVLRLDIERDNEPECIESDGFNYHLSFFPVIDIESINIYTGEHRVIVQDGYCPAWSHDGRYLAFIRYERLFEINPQFAEHHNVPAIFDTVSGEIRYLTDDKTSTYFYSKKEGYPIRIIFEPIFCPNEASTYFINMMGGYSGKRYWDPIFSPDDTQIIVCGADYDSSSNDGQIFSSELFMIPIHGGKPEQLTFSETINNHQEIIIRPRFSQDEQHIIFEKRTVSSKEEFIRSSLLSYNVKTRDKYELTVSQNVEEFIRSSLLSYNTKMREKHELIESQNGIVTYAWAPDGTKYCFENKETVKTEDLFARKPYEGKTLDIIRLYTCNLDIKTLLKKTSPFDNTAELSSFKLIGNYPNPFNPTTTINFSLPVTGFVNLNIYNITGQKVRELVSESLEPGTHSVLWDGKDYYGRMVSSGIYISQLRMGNNVQTHKMTMVK